MVLNALTIDLEDWYQGLTSTNPLVDRWSSYESRVEVNTERVLEMLANAGVKATFFVLGYVAHQFPELIRKVAEEGHEIALHSYIHRRVHSMTLEQFREDIMRGLEAIQAAIGQRVLGYRAPMFSLKGDVTAYLRELAGLGFRYDSSIFPIRNGYYGLPNAPRLPYRPFDDCDFIEFPLSTVRLLGVNLPIAGGFYGRAYPEWITHSGIRRLNREGYPAVIYAHPWEFDTGQRYNQVTLRERVTHYYGRKSLSTKFVHLLKEFNFGSLSSLADGMG